MFDFLNKKKGLKILDKVPEHSPRISLRRNDVSVREVLDVLAVMFGTHAYAQGREGVLFGLKDILAVPEWKKTIYKTLKEKKISVDFKDTDILKAFAQVLREAKLDLHGMLEDKPLPRITFSATDMPVEDVLDGMGDLAGFGWIIERNAVWPMTPARVASRKKSIWATRTRDLDEKTAKALGLGGPYGAIVVSVPKDSPGYRTGLKKNDVVLDLNGIRIMDAAEYDRTMPMGGLSKQYRIRIMRKGTLMVLDLKLK